MPTEPLWQGLLSREHWIVAGALAIAIALAWAALFAMDVGAGSMTMTQAGGMDAMPGWSASYAVSVFLMWTVMMVAMMLPSAAPMILLYARVARHAQAGAALAPSASFAGVYVAVWTAFSLAATLAQWLLTQVGVVSDATMALGDARVGGALLIAAGLYQLTPLKRMCLAHCRSPLSILTTHWRPGISGAVRLGLAHGGYCLGCCWLIMALLFVGGVMNLVWVVALAAIVLAEKVLPYGERVGQGAGALALFAGIALIIDPVFLQKGI